MEGKCTVGHTVYVEHCGREYLSVVGSVCVGLAPWVIRLSLAVSCGWLGGRHLHTQRKKERNEVGEGEKRKRNGEVRREYSEGGGRRRETR